MAGTACGVSRLPVLYKVKLHFFEIVAKRSVIGVKILLQFRSQQMF